MTPELLVGRCRVVQCEHFQNEWNDDGERRSEDQNLINGKAQNTEDLQDLHDIVGDSRGARGQAGPKSDEADGRQGSALYGHECTSTPVRNRR